MLLDPVEPYGERSDSAFVTLYQLRERFAERGVRGSHVRGVLGVLGGDVLREEPVKYSYQDRVGRPVFDDDFDERGCVHGLRISGSRVRLVPAERVDSDRQCRCQRHALERLDVVMPVLDAEEYGEEYRKVEDRRGSRGLFRVGNVEGVFCGHSRKGLDEGEREVVRERTVFVSAAADGFRERSGRTYERRGNELSADVRPIARSRNPQHGGDARIEEREQRGDVRTPERGGERYARCQGDSVIVSRDVEGKIPFVMHDVGHYGYR